MPQLKELLVEQLQDLLHAETQLTGGAAKDGGSRPPPEAERGLRKTSGPDSRARRAPAQCLRMLGEKAEPKPCKAMMGLVEEGKETIEEGADKEPLAADLALIAAAQRVEHYEISAYGTARCLPVRSARSNARVC